MLHAVQHSTKVWFWFCGYGYSDEIERVSTATTLDAIVPISNPEVSSSYYSWR